MEIRAFLSMNMLHFILNTCKNGWLLTENIWFDNTARIFSTSARYNMNSYYFGIGLPRLGVLLQHKSMFIWTIYPMMESRYNINSYIFGLPDPILGSRYNMNLYLFGPLTPSWGSVTEWIHIFLDCPTPSWGPVTIFEFSIFIWTTYPIMGSCYNI